MDREFSCIGFYIGSAEELLPLCEEHPEALTAADDPSDGGAATRLLCPDGRIELWFFERNGVPRCVPGYRSDRAVTVIPERWSNDGAAQLPILEGDANGCPLILTVPGGSVSAAPAGVPRRMDVTLFAKKLNVYPDTETFLRRFRGRMEPEAMIPTGTFCSETRNECLVTDSTAMVNGIVTDAVLRENPLSGGQYWELGLRCCGCCFTAVADTALLPEPPMPGSVVQGSFRLSGRFLPSGVSVFREIPFCPEISALEHSAFFLGDLTDGAAVALWEKAVREAKPKAMVAQVEITHAPDGRVTHVGGQPVCSAVLDKNLAGLHRAFAYAATCGTELTAVCDADADADSKALVFAVRILALRAAVEYATARVMEDHGIPKLAMMNPGSLPEWPLAEQAKLFALLGNTEAGIGVRLGDNMFMYPTESSSGLMFETDHDYKNCMVCTRLDCVGRQAPYDEALAKELRG